MVDFVGNRNLRQLLTERAGIDPGKVFLVHEAVDGTVEEMTYSSFVEAVNRAAAGFGHIGVRRGDAVTVLLPNCPEFLVSWFGLATVGAVMVPANTANTAPELRHVIDHSESTTVVTWPPLLSHVDDALAGLDRSVSVVLCRATDSPPDGVTGFDAMLAAADPGRSEIADVQSEDLAELLFTSGTTSRPKAVILTHANCLRAGERTARNLALQDSDRCLTALPLFHVNAQEVTALAALTVGGTCILLEEFRASLYWDQVRRHRATQTSLVAMQVRTLLARSPASDDPVHDLRRVFYAINVSATEKEAFEKRFAVELINGYGLSESMTVVSVAPVFGPKRWPSVGLPAYDREIQILDAAGRPVPPGTVGEIVVGGVPGRSLMKGYFKDPEATARALRDGWLYTGDFGHLDELGYLYFFDRKKDVIKVAGENVSAAEVEAVLNEHPDIVESAVVGVADPIRDQAVKAFVVPREGAAASWDELTEFCSTRLAPFKIPTAYQVMDALPRTSIGKLEKKRLREEPS